MIFKITVLLHFDFRDSVIVIFEKTVVYSRLFI